MLCKRMLSDASTHSEDVFRSLMQSGRFDKDLPPALHIRGHWVHVVPTILSPAEKKINNQDSIICPLSSTCLVIHSKFYGKLHNPRYSSTMQLRKKILNLSSNNTNVHCNPCF